MTDRVIVINTVPPTLVVTVPEEPTVDIHAALRGPTGERGKSAYQSALDDGFTGTESAWLDSLVGPTGAAGRTILNGSGAPSSGTGIDGDFYLDTSAWDIYGPKTSGAWGSGTTILGDVGSDGADGRTILNGSGAPSSGLGANGDFYVDTTAHAIYGPKAAGAWGSSTSLIGPTGATGAAGTNGINGTNGTNGADGTDGNTVLHGSGAPSSGLGVDGDWYIDTTARSMYGPKTGGSWGSATSLLGPSVDVVQGRLTATSGDPEGNGTSSSSTLYFCPYNGNYITLYDTGESTWKTVSFTEVSLALGTVTADLPYDVFAYLNSGSVALQKVAWTSGTARATTPSWQDGRLCKGSSSDKAYRYLGTICPDSTTTVCDKTLYRGIWNYFNTIEKRCAPTLPSASHNYTTGTWREYNGGTDVVRGKLVVGYSRLVLAEAGVNTDSSGGSQWIATYIDNAATVVVESGRASSGYFHMSDSMKYTIAAGYHDVTAKQFGGAGGTFDAPISSISAYL